jgi:hypothetical protein
MKLRDVAGIVAGGLIVTAISGRSFTGRALAPGTERVLFDIDLTTGQPGGGKVSAGAWDRGWKTTGAKNERGSCLLRSGLSRLVALRAQEFL